MYSILLIANNILDRSFFDDIPLTSGKLQRITYLVDSEYRTLTGEPLVSEQWETWAHGAHSSTLHYVFQGDSDKKITKYSHSISGRTLKAGEIQDSLFTLALSNIWESTKHLTYQGLCHISRLPHSAWDKAFQAEEKIIGHQDMVEDITYRDMI